MKNELKSNNRKELFDEWKTLGLDISFQLNKIETLKNIIQNPGPVSEEKIQEWRELALQNWVEFKNNAEQFLIEYKDLVKRVLDHLRENID